MIKATQVIGLPIYTVHSGSDIGAVKDVVYDPQTNRVEAFVLEEGGWFSDTKVILMNDVHSIGEDAVLVQREELIKQANEIKQKVANIAKGDNYLTANKILTESGNDLGHVSDLIFDSTNGNVVEFEVSRGALQDVGTGKKSIHINDIITIGKDVIIVRTHTEHAFDEQAKERGITGSLNKGKDKAGDMFDETKNKSQELAAKAGQKTHEIKESSRTKNIIDNVKTHARQAKENIQQGAAQMKEKTEHVKENEDIRQAADTIKRQAEKTKQLAEENIARGKEKIQEKSAEYQEQQAESTDDTMPVADLTPSVVLTPTKEPEEVVIQEVEEKVVLTPDDRYTPMYGSLGGKTKKNKK